MAEITIGGITHKIDEFNFVAVEMAWPFMEQAMATVHPIAGTNAALAVIAAGMMESEGFDPKKWNLKLEQEDPETKQMFPVPIELVHIEMTNILRRRIKSNEMGAVKLCLFAIIEEAGFDLRDALPGGANPVGAETSLSPGTVISTSQSSSLPELKEEAGTA